MRFDKSLIIAAAASLWLMGPAAQAGALSGTFAVTAYTGLTNGSGFNATSTNPFAGGGANVASATFSYTGALNFNNSSAPDLNSSFGYTTGNISNYSGSGTVVSNATTIADFSTVMSFLNSTGSAGGFPYGSWYSFDLGTLAAGTILTISHDDGASLYQNGSLVAGLTSGPTAQITETVRLTGTANTKLYYSRQNGAPSVLQVNIPEPSSLAALLSGLGALTLMRRRRLRL